jgi:hypothetical protein
MITRRRLPPARPNPLRTMHRMRQEILDQNDREMPERLQAENLALLAQELLLEAGRRRGRAYARVWLDVIEAHLRSDLSAAADAMARLP